MAPIRQYIDKLSYENITIQLLMILVYACDLRDNLH